MVLLCHIRGRVPELHNTPVGSILTAFGYWAVSVFFFISGYGLMEAYKYGGDEYVNRFPIKKILPFYLTIWLFAFAYIAKRIVIGTEINWQDIPRVLVYPGDWIDNGWYLNTQLIFYWLFYIGFKTEKGMAFTSIGVIVYIVVCIMLGKTTTVYESVLPFILGLLCSDNKKRVVDVLFKRRKYCLWSIVFLFVVTMLLGNTYLLSEPLRISFKMLSSCSFACLAVCVSTWMKPIGLLKWLGKYSLGIYAMQGLWLDSDILIAQGSIVYTGSVVLSTIISAVIITPMVNHIKNLAKQ